MIHLHAISDEKVLAAQHYLKYHVVTKVKDNCVYGYDRDGFSDEMKPERIVVKWDEASWNIVIRYYRDDLKRR